MSPHYTVAAALIIREGKIFCARRPDTGESAGTWEFPGGKVEPGERIEEALIREIQEEFNSDIAILAPIGTVEHTYRTCSITLYAYMCRVTGGLLVPVEHTGSRWLAADELDSVQWSEADIPIVEMVRGLLARQSSNGKNTEKSMPDQ